MEFIFNICCLVAFSIGLFAGIRFWKSYKKTEILQSKYFSLGFLLISLSFLILSLPNLILFNPFWIQIDFILVDLTLSGAGLFLLPATFSFVKSSNFVQKMFFWGISSVLVVYALLNVFFFAPAVSLCSEGMCYWKNGVFWLHSIIWIPFALGEGLIGTWFLLEAKKIKDGRLFWKTFLFGLTSILIFIAGILFWYFKFFHTSYKVLVMSGIIGDFGFLFGLIGSFLHQPSREEFVKKIN
jgi:hypothetical protein